MIIFANACVASGKPHKRVIIHVPMKVKHVHHTHTVYKPIHHTVPVNLEEHELHVVKPDNHGWNAKEYQIEAIGNGRDLSSILSKIHLPNAHFEDDRSGEYHQDFEKYLKKRSKNKQKLFNNNIIGWKGRPGFDKIANEFLLNIKNQPSPDYDDYDQRYAPYDDESDDDEEEYERRKRK